MIESQKRGLRRFECLEIQNKLYDNKQMLKYTMSKICYNEKKKVIPVNFIAISPTFPKYYYNFCDCLKKRGVTVLGIGDVPGESFTEEERQSFSEYCYVPNLENYEDVLKTVAYFIYKYGRIDYIASHNEYWLETEAKLRDDFNIPTGMHSDDVVCVKFKTIMKEICQVHHIPTAPYLKLSTFKKARSFARKIGYPVIVKPDYGMGAMHVHKMKNEVELAHFYTKNRDYDLMMEPYIEAAVETYDGLTNRQGEVIFETSMVFPTSLMEIVNERKDSIAIIQKEVPDDLRQLGKKVLHAFPSQATFFHIECYRLKEDQSLLVGEVNMRLPGSIAIEAINYVHNIDLYDLYAKMLTGEKLSLQADHDHYGVVVGRRDDIQYHYALREIKYKYQKALVMSERIPAIYSDVMGDMSFSAKFTKESDVNQFIHDCIRRAKR
jgi:hypothetical protein